VAKGERAVAVPKGGTRIRCVYADWVIGAAFRAGIYRDDNPNAGGRKRSRRRRSEGTT
jgi:hypothetical protein